MKAALELVMELQAPFGRDIALELLTPPNRPAAKLGRGLRKPVRVPTARAETALTPMVKRNLREPHQIRHLGEPQQVGRLFQRARHRLKRDYVRGPGARYEWVVLVIGRGMGVMSFGDIRRCRLAPGFSERIAVEHPQQEANDE